MKDPPCGPESEWVQKNQYFLLTAEFNISPRCFQSSRFFYGLQQPHGLDRLVPLRLFARQRSLPQ
jgi:hypothetical protein